MARDQYIIGKAAGALAKARQFLPAGTVVYLLKRGENSGDFADDPRDVTNDFWSRWNEYREQTQFVFATTNADFRDDFALCTHIGYGVPDDDDEIDVFEILDDQKDKIFPTGSSPFYKAFANRVTNQRFEVS